MSIEEWKLVISLISLGAIITGTILVLSQLRENRNTRFFNILMRGEKDFDELNKLMLSDQDLRDTYRLEDPVLENVDDNHLKKFVFYEL